jgi:hypothetical protein
MYIIGVLQSQPSASRQTYFYHLSGAALFIVDAGNLSFATCFNTTTDNLWVECKVALTPEINQYPLPLKIGLQMIRYKLVFSYHCQHTNSNLIH